MLARMSSSKGAFFVYAVTISLTEVFSFVCSILYFVPKKARSESIEPRTAKMIPLTL